ncbi:MULTISPECIES: MarR family winged helix-turn-helix transcriptional regulator [Rhizobium]|uniref:MarR family transcriptional regulator n=1 Tax=Rhizobium changzhiense TaxID=2692317 RepID=A0ABR6ACP4_9HYPH|nr:MULTISPECIES: MarR family transcriptional regulator [Rhizobium]MBA5804389.1 MarR family transcriptional regulator [Rhizobium changzhiense]MCH4546493.1 MarR family transcriptional regulator [Rhizobium changzhiense]MCV9942650.1 MarR family transcriptional regulator [Rhizobium sp. BT-175]MCW0015389.1 MarR family transcriptional regulator [Rhizobium sp. BT-226]NNU47837.1 MarR family transcriptional regulator [Rhizobium changzhiense]
MGPTKSKTKATKGQLPQQLEDYVGYHLRRASALNMQDITNALATVGQRPSGFSVACIINEQPGITSAEICRMLGLQRANIVPLLDELSGPGYISRVDDERDKRVQRLYLTDAGYEALETWHDIVFSHEERVLANLSPSERDLLRELLAKIWN